MMRRFASRMTISAQQVLRTASARAYDGVYATYGRGFSSGAHVHMSKPNVASFIRENVKRCDVRPELSGASAKTSALWAQVEPMILEEMEKGVIDIDTRTPSRITSHAPGYVDKDVEVIQGLQTDEPFKLAIKPFGGVNTVRNACHAYGYELDPSVEQIFTQYRKTHNDAVFDIYTKDMRAARRAGILTGLPDAYGRGRLIGDYRRVALYGVDALIDAKQADKDEMDGAAMDEDTMRLREEISAQIRALKELKEMGSSYGFDISRPADNATEAVQWTWLAYLGAIKEQDGAAMSMGRLDSFFDIFIEKDIEAGVLDEEGAQELIDQFVIKCRMVRHLRTPEYNELFAGMPQWVTMVLGGMDNNGEDHLVTKTSYRILQTLYNLGPGPEPNMTVLWSSKLPQDFKDFCAEISIDTSTVQYENDDLMRSCYGGSDYAIACCVSGMEIGRQMQFFGARCNLAKLLLYAINGGRDEISGVQVAPTSSLAAADLETADGYLDYPKVESELNSYMDWLAELYVNTMNVIHYAHDKYDYEALQMALHDSEIHRFMAFGVAGASVIADSLSAIKYANVKAVRDPQTGLTTDFTVDGEFPAFGNDDPDVDQIYYDTISKFMDKLRSHPTYRDSEHTLSLLTITSNNVYGKKSGSTPDQRKQGEPFAPGANPMHGRDTSGALASLNSVAGMDYDVCRDGISNTFTIVPSALGKGRGHQVQNLTAMLDGYFDTQGHHLNVNVLDRETLLKAAKNPELYPRLTIRVSGYAVRLASLNYEQRMEVVARTFHDMM